MEKQYSGSSNQSKALIIYTKTNLRDKFPEFFDDYVLLHLIPRESNLYSEANKAVQMARNFRTIVLVADHTTLTAMVAAKLGGDFRNFLLATWKGRRFRVLSIP